MTDLDPRFTFDSFVVGPANRLATAAARRAAESPGTSYNPLFLYSASGLGKTHILTAVAHHALKGDESPEVEYLALEGYLDGLTTALEMGARDGFRERYGDLDILLLDDVQFLAGQSEAQEMLLRTLDQLSSNGSQIVLASDRAPAEIDGLDARLLSRFSGGLIVDIGAPEYETRVAIIRKKTSERAQELGPGVAQALARYPFRNVRELGGALNKIFARQELEGSRVTPDVVAELMGEEGATLTARGKDEFGTFLEDVAGAVATTVEAQEKPWRKAVREQIEAAEREGFAVQRLRELQRGQGVEDWEELLERFRADIQRLRDIDAALDRLGNPWPEAEEGVLNDPDRLGEAEALLTSVRERQRPFPRLADGPRLDDLSDYPAIVIKAARQLVAKQRPEYNPLYMWSEKSERGRALLGATGRTYQTANPGAQMAVTSVKDFASDFIRALGEGVAGAWRERWWTVDLLLVHGVEELSRTERAQDEFFHLFEALKRRGARIMMVADRIPAGVERIDERLRSRFEGGLVLEIESGTGQDKLELLPRDEVAPGEGDRSGILPGGAEGLTMGTLDGLLPAALQEPPRRQSGAWFPSRENAVIHWPVVEDLIHGEMD
ncbi:MAG: DnaA/Hda family protein [Gemmatimonadota bacterium]|jgi:chromosomal replication initiator protein